MKEQDVVESREAGSKRPADPRGKPIENPPSNVTPRTDPPPTPPPYDGPKGGGNHGHQ